MKKSLVPALIALAATTFTAYGQGFIALDNYDSTAHPLVTYGAGFTGETPGTPIGEGAGYNVGFYYVNAAGNFTSDFSADPFGFAEPSELYSGPGVLVLATGHGSTATVADINAFNHAGEYASPYSFSPGLGAGATVTLMLIAYNSSSFDSATLRTHSSAFTMTTSVGASFPGFTGDSETDGGMTIFTIPEPSAFALSGVGAAALILIRPKK